MISQRKELAGRVNPLRFMHLDELAGILQTAISPVALISGVGLLVLSITNRFARTTDRARILARQIREAAEDETEHIAIQIKILYKRSKILLLSISFALASAFFASLLIISLFIISLLDLHLQSVVMLLFIISLLSLVVSILLFIEDMSLSLKALKEELRNYV